ncbi:AAA family ATPase [Natrinema soli]|uniref:AAA family ATPase n=1 Tax=Natrinema soli TaxID=1930624 RepID=A0ABD5SKE2_9EURY|nr:AAA family ATPase [Natrinema soli]
MNESDQDAILRLWDEFTEDDYRYLDESGEKIPLTRRKQQREDRLPHIQDLITSFQAGDLPLFEFRTEMDSESKQHRYWGFGGMSQMFFNMYCNETQRQDRTSESTTRLQEAIRVPADSAGASEQIDHFESYVETLKSNAENKRKAPQAGFIPAFVSFFWQAQAPDTVPVYYESSREGYKELGVWKPRGDLGERYAAFWETTIEIRELIERQRDEDPSLWAVEYTILRYRNRSKRPDDTRGTTEGEQGGIGEESNQRELETYADFEAQQRALGIDEMAIDVTGLYFDDLDEILAQARTALRNGNNIILVGPPGTGKTKLAKQICRSVVGDSFRMTTATADWSTFDTIGGYRPTGDDGLTFKPGVFLSQFQDEDGAPQNEWLIVDEINRADIDKAFGSLFSALTGEDVTLPFSDTDGKAIEIIGDENSQELSIEPYRYYVPQKWRMIATMNTLDKTSLYEMSYAFMRRWAFIPIRVPDRESIDGELVAQYVEVWDDVEVDLDRCETVASIWRVINRFREIGPAIVEDIYTYLRVPSSDPVAPILLHVVPQLEGLRDEQLVQFVGAMGEIDGLDEPRLGEFVADYYQIPPERFDQ